MNMLEMRVVGVIRRRELLQRDPPVRWAQVIDEIRRTGYTTTAICRALNVARSTLWQWETFESCPNYEDGRALLKLRSLCRPNGT
jgi:DNA-binding transcriptional regulator YiaG